MLKSVNDWKMGLDKAAASDTILYHTSFEFEGAMAYNKLPETIRSITTIQAFRRVMAHVKVLDFCKFLQKMSFFLPYKLVEIFNV